MTTPDRAPALSPTRRMPASAAGRAPIPMTSFGSVGHNLMRYRPVEVVEAVLSAARQPTSTD